MVTRPIGNSPNIQPLQSDSIASAESSAIGNLTGKDKDLKTKGKTTVGNYQVDVSNEALELSQARQKALEIARNTPEVREDRVAEFKAQIAAGTYKPDAGNIADGMLREAIRDRLAEEER